MARLGWLLLGGIVGCAEAPPNLGAQPVPAPAPSASAELVSSSAPAPSTLSIASASASAKLEAPPAPAEVEKLDLGADKPAFLVKGRGAEPPRAVFLPGLCSNAYAYLLAFPEAARSFGGIVAIDGDRSCGVAGFHSFSGDDKKTLARIEAALAAAGRASIPEGGITLVGYSQGASIAERLTALHPDKFTRIVLMGSPKDPVVARIKTARAVATMSCALDVPHRMKSAAKRLEAAGVPARYFEMPRCTHGNIEDGERVFGEVFGWLAR